MNFNLSLFRIDANLRRMVLFHTLLPTLTCIFIDFKNVKTILTFCRSHHRIRTVEETFAGMQVGDRGRQWGQSRHPTQSWRQGNWTRFRTSTKLK
jgi:hypothetical protein